MQTEKKTQPTPPSAPVYTPPRVVQTIDTGSIECGVSAIDGVGYGTGFVIGGIEGKRQHKSRRITRLIHSTSKAKRAQFPWLSAFYVSEIN
jgi:hypothetical protein